MIKTAPEPDPEKLPTGADLGWPAALLHAIFDRPIGFYPRLIDEGAVKTRAVETLIEEHVKATSGWDSLKDADPDDMDQGIELAKASLSEAKAQTEYQDQKATRLLTVTTFLSALSAGLYAAFNSGHPMSAIYDNGPVAATLQILAHIAFLLFVLAALAGMLITFHATRTQFKYPESATVERQDEPTRSFLFFREMVGVTPAAWANSFITPPATASAKPSLRPDLRVEYLKNYVGEAYLIAAKAADKLRYLEPAQSLLAWALRCLLGFILLYVIISVVVPAAPSKPTQFEAAGGKPLPVRLRQ